VTLRTVSVERDAAFAAAYRTRTAVAVKGHIVQVTKQSGVLLAAAAAMRNVNRLRCDAPVLGHAAKLHTCRC
jgi:hypothetical protein